MNWNSYRSWPHQCALMLALASSACSPTLNWRVVHLQQLTALLPCKPDQAQRMVRLGSQDVQMRMAGCEAGGALFAISLVDAGARSNVPTVLAAWRTVTLKNLGGATPAPLPFKVAPTLQAGEPIATDREAGQADVPPERVIVTGKHVDGSVIQAQLAWIVVDTAIYQIGVYGPQLTPDMTETLFAEVRTQ